VYFNILFDISVICLIAATPMDIEIVNVVGILSSILDLSISIWALVRMIVLDTPSKVLAYSWVALVSLWWILFFVAAVGLILRDGDRLDEWLAINFGTQAVLTLYDAICACRWQSEYENFMATQGSSCSTVIEREEAG